MEPGWNPAIPLKHLEPLTVNCLGKKTATCLHWQLTDQEESEVKMTSTEPVSKDFTTKETFRQAQAHIVWCEAILLQKVGIPQWWPRVLCGGVFSKYERA